MKGQYSGELNASKMMAPFITIEQYGSPGWVDADDLDLDADRRMAKRGLARSMAAMLSGDYDLVILDEINTAHFCRLVSLKEMFELIVAKPDGVELVFTGRYAPRELIAEADLVTEMTPVKHYYDRGVPARDGIER